MKNEIKKEESKEMTINDMATTVNTLAVKVDTLATTVDTLSTTVENLAIMTARSFERTATKEEMKAGFDEVNTHLAIIENIKFRGLENRLELQEDKMLQAQVFLKTKFA